ncbi:MAG: hypothetical protein IJT73_01320 [Selenomonadaceae bacterium]|nr:hypothetical protein [Selenomonadaceae bacterium]
MDKKIIYSLLSNVLIAYSAIFVAPVTFAILVQDFDSAIFFSVIGICAIDAERSLKKSKKYRKINLLWTRK